MVKCKTEITQRELDVLIEIWLSSEKNVKKRKQGRIAFAILAILLALFTAYFYFHYAIATAVILGVFCIFSAFMATVGATLEQKWILKKVQNRANARMKSGVREYEFSENGVAIRSEIGRSENKWSAFKLWGTYEDYIYLRRVDDGMILVDKGNLSGDDVDELVALLNANIKVN